MQDSLEDEQKKLLSTYSVLRERNWIPELTEFFDDRNFEDLELSLTAFQDGASYLEELATIIDSSVPVIIQSLRAYGEIQDQTFVNALTAYSAVSSFSQVEDSSSDGIEIPSNFFSMLTDFQKEEIWHKHFRAYNTQHLKAVTNIGITFQNVHDAVGLLFDVGDKKPFTYWKNAAIGVVSKKSADIARARQAQTLLASTSESLDNCLNA